MRTGTLDKKYPLEYILCMVEVRQTEQYADWFARLRDRQAKVRIDIRIRRLSLGNPGDAKSVGGGVSELRSDSTQSADIARAKELAALL